MIIYIFNNNFPDSSGFGKRCLKEIELLSRDNDITIICRRSNRKERNVFKTKYKQIKIERFYAESAIMERINNSLYTSGYYELKRNIDLLMGLSKSLLKVFIKNKNEKYLKIYTVVSPLTVPLIVWLLTKLFNRTPAVIEFHDLEPEMAQHIKRIDKNSIVMKIEFFLEKLMCKSYNKVVVTNETQKRRIIDRTKLDKDKVLVIPNSIQLSGNYDYESKHNRLYGISKSDIVLGYISNFSYNYSISGLLKLIKYIAKSDKNMRFKLLLVGDGDGLGVVKEVIKKYSFEDKVIITGRVDDIKEILTTIDIALIPWEQDIYSETILPTKLLEYMAAKKAVLVPDFGEFRSIIKEGFNGMLYKTTKDLLLKLNFVAHNKSLRKKIGENAYNSYVAEFDTNKLEQKYKLFIANI